MRTNRAAHIRAQSNQATEQLVDRCCAILAQAIGDVIGKALPQEKAFLRPLRGGSYELRLASGKTYRSSRARDLRYRAKLLGLDCIEK